MASAHETKLDFKQLSSEFPSLKPFLNFNSNGGISFKWKNSEGIRELSKVLLKKDYSIDIYLPPDRLPPTVTLRANYIKWLLSLCDDFKINKKDVFVLDIGTGASCIYPLLGVSIAGWSFVATEIDPFSVEIARKNVDLNHFGDMIKVIHVKDQKSIFLGVVEEGQRFQFSMCNPPFFSDVDDIGKNKKSSIHQTSQSGELVTTGGELSFIKQMVMESMHLQTQIIWYTSMIGKKVDLNAIIRFLKTKKIRNFRSTAFLQGKTTRWGIAWSFTDIGLKELVHRQLEPVFKKRKLCSNHVSLELTQTDSKSIMVMLMGFLEKEKQATLTSIDSLLGTIEGDFEGHFRFKIQIMQTRDGRHMLDISFKGGDREPFELFLTEIKCLFAS